MKCRVCGGRLQPITTDLPFKISEKTIVIITNLPVLQCEHCSEYSMDDATFARVEVTLAQTNKAAELEIVPFARQRPREPAPQVDTIQFEPSK